MISQSGEQPLSIFKVGAVRDWTEKRAAPKAPDKLRLFFINMRPIRVIRDDFDAVRHSAIPHNSSFAKMIRCQTLPLES